jgi:long-chain-fatty-acid--CoA ligase ACSBG
MCCGVYPSDTEAQFMVKNQFANASISIVGDEEKLAFVENILSELPYLKAVVCWGARKKITTPGHASAKLRLSRKDGSSVPVLSWSMFMALGDKEPEDALDKLTELVKPGHACSVIFTSGTMGVPKGCLLTHDNFVFAATVIMTQGTPHMAAVATDEERVLSVRPRRARACCC